DWPSTGTWAVSTILAQVDSRSSLRSKMTLTWSCWTSLVALATAIDGVFWSSTMVAWTGWPLMPPAALVASTQSWKTVFASAVEPAPAPVKLPMAPTAIGVPLALLALPAALGLLAALALAGALADVLAGALAELDDEDEQPTAVSAARARTAAAAPVDLRPACLRPGLLRVIFASFL